MPTSDWKGIINLLLGSGRNNELMKKLDAAIEKYDPEVNNSCPRRQILLRALCKANVQLGKRSEIDKWCEELSKMEGMEEDIDVLVGRGIIAQSKEEWQEAVNLFAKAFEKSERQDRDIHQRLVKAQKLLKQSKARDYYKVLGVARDADKKTIKKALYVSFHLNQA
jgi:DnaJ family protein C protein 3